MVGGTQSLDDVLEQARKLQGKFEDAFNVPVLVIEGEEDADLDEATEVTSPDAPHRTPDGAKAGPGLVIPLQPRFPAAGDLKLSFGRSTVCDVVLPFVSISKHHGFLCFEAGQWTISDVGSRNGTLLAGRKVGEGPVPLPDGASVEIGKIAVRFLGVRAFHQFLHLKLGFG